MAKSSKATKKSPPPPPPPNHEDATEESQDTGAAKRPPPAAQLFDSPPRRSKLSSALGSIVFDKKNDDDDDDSMDSKKKPKGLLNLSDFGIKSSPKKISSEPDKNCTLRACVIKPPHSAILFRLEPNDATGQYGAYAEKFFNDAVFAKRNNKPGHHWIHDINVDNETIEWYHQGEAMLNNKGYAIRLFVIYVDPLPSHSSIMRLGQYICDQLNAYEKNWSKVSIDPTSFFWIPGTAVWSEVRKPQEAYALMCSIIGDPASHDDHYYETNKDTIHNFFREGTIPLKLARRLGAPIEVVDPDDLEHLSDDESILKEEEKDGDKKPPAN
jgi:hypothetical protein